jgi:hypothetical protein
LEPFAVQCEEHRAGRADVGCVQVADLLDAGGGVVERGEQDGVAQSAPGGRVWLGEERFDLVAGEVAHVGGRGLLLLDGDDLGRLVEELWPLDRGVAGERLDHGEALVAGRWRVVAFGLQPVQEREHAGSVEVGEAQLVGRDRLRVAKPGKQQLDRVSVGGDRLSRQVPLASEVVGEEPGQPAAGELPAGRVVDAAHWSPPSRGAGPGMTCPNLAWTISATAG